MRMKKRIIIYALAVSAFFAGFGGGGNKEAPFRADRVKAAQICTAQSASSAVSDRTKLIPGGCPFGVKIYSDGLIVVGFGKVDGVDGSREPALEAGVRMNDLVTHINGEKTATAEEFTAKIEASGGAPVELRLKRGERELTLNVVPAKTHEGKWRIGLWVRDSTAGIGTVTYVVPGTNEFGGLGHGICDSSTGEVVPLARGTVADVRIASVVRGICGTPGELKGGFASGRRGVLAANTANGVFGVFTSLPAPVEGRNAIPVGSRDEVRDGDATVLCTLGDDGICAYTVKISEIDRGDVSSKSFAVTVTDVALIERTGGIVQGMSGSPIIQDGKLVGAVTHVLISDPTRGYGIFIENMLSAMPETAG